MGDENYKEKYKEAAEADVASIEVGDSSADVEAKVLGLAHLTGVPSEVANDADESGIKA